MRRSVKSTVLWGTLGLLLLIGALLILPWFLNPEYLQSLVLRQIQQTFGSHVQVGRTTLAFFPSPHFLVDDIVVKEQVDSHAVFRAKSMSLELGIGQLLQKKLVVEEFILDYPEIEIRRNTSGDWRFLGYSNRDSSFSFLASFLVLGRIEVTNGKIIVIDESPSESVRGVVFENVACLSDTSYEGVAVHSTWNLSGNLRQTQDSAYFRLSGTFETTSNIPLSSWDTKNIVFEQMTFAGKLETKNIAMDQLAEFVPYPKIFTQFPGKLNVESEFKWVKKETTSQFQFSNIALVNPALSLVGNAIVEGLEDGNQMTSVSLRSSSLNLEMIRQAVPLSWLPVSLANTWEKGEWGGELKVLDARVTSSTREDVGTSVTGTFQVNHGFLSNPEWPRTELVQGTVVVEPDRIQVSKANGVYDGIPVDVKKGVLFLKETGAWGEVEIEGPVPAEKVWNFVRDLLPPSSDPSGWHTWKVSQGSGLLQLRFAGGMFDEGDFVFQRGDYQPTNVVVQIPGLLHPLTHGHGKIQFSPDSTVFEGIKGEMGAYPFTLDGTLIHQDQFRVEPLTVTAGFEGNDLLQSAERGPAESGFHLTGPLHASLTMRGPISRLGLKGKIDGGKAAITIPGVLRKETGQPGVLEFDGHLQSGGTVRFERIELAMLPLRLRGQGIGRFRPTWGWKGRLDSGPISLAVIPEKIELLGNAIQSGILEVQLGGNGLGKDWTQWNVKGWLALTDGRISMPGIRESIEDVFVRLRIDKDFLDVKRMEFHIKDSQAVVTGFVKQWTTTPQVSVMCNASQFDIDLLIPKDERSVLRDGVEWLASHGKLEGSLIIKRPRYKTFSGSTFSAELNVHDNLVAVDKIQTMVEKNGSAKGRVFVHLPPGKPAAVRASFEGQNLPFEKILKTLGDERRLITGQMNIRGKIQGHGRDARGIIPTLEGGVELSLKNGYVRQGTVLPKILSILNLPHLLRGKVNFDKTGFPYDTVRATLAIEEGDFSSKDFQLRSPVMNATAAGTYDFSHDHLDGVVAVSPFGAYSDVLKSIPLFGTIFSGDRKGIATAMFIMNGPLKDPQVVYMPKESLESGLTGLAQLAFDVLKNTMLAPVQVLKGVVPEAVPEPNGPRQVTPKNLE